MSFKRDGDDIILLDRLKENRISELLGFYVPEDEAKLLSNGSLACLVCSHCPVLSTVRELANHRKGRKHYLELKKHFIRNEQIQLKKLKKEQEEYVKNCKAAELAKFKSNSLVLGPRDSCTLSNEDLKIGKRRKLIDIPDITYQSLTDSTIEQNRISTSSSQLRKYLKKIKKEPPFEKLVEREKSSYSFISSNLKNEVQPSPSKCEVRPMTLINQNCSTSKSDDSDFSRNLSGWIRDKFGNWIKDPEAEFDTDDESDDVKQNCIKEEK